MQSFWLGLANGSKPFVSLVQRYTGAILLGRAKSWKRQQGRKNQEQLHQTLQFTFILKKCFVKNTPTKALEQQVSVSFINTSDLFHFF